MREGCTQESKAVGEAPIFLPWTKWSQTLLIQDGKGQIFSDIDLTPLKDLGSPSHTLCLPPPNPKPN